MKKSILLVAVLMALVSLCLVLASCDSGSSDSASTVAVESVSLGSETLTLKTGKSGTLTATVLPENATDKSVTWSSDDETVATVDQNGKVIGVSVGTATITVKTKDGGKTADCEVTVSANTYTISFNANGGSGTMDSGSVVEGETYTIPENKFTEPAGTLRSFAGWNTAADGSGTAYAAGATIESVTANITLYAQWTKPSFSVSTTEKVYFSKGNLYYDGNSWNFENNQYDFRTYEEKNSCINGVVKTDGTPSDNWGLFGWSTDGGTPPSANYKPWGINNSTDNSDCSGDFKNWGENAISNGGGTANTWRTLSSAEWDYLLKTRSDANRFAKANVNGVKGLLIFPDGYNGGTAISGITGVAAVNDNMEGFPGTSIDDDTWSAMEAAGVVFLPAAGFRNGSNVIAVDSGGYYWSATHGGSGNYACELFFTDSDVNPAHDGGRCYGHSVRLVCGG